MPHIAENPAFGIPRIASHPKHFDIVISFQHQDIRSIQRFLHLIADITEVRRDAQLLVAVIEAITDRCRASWDISKGSTRSVPKSLTS